MSYIADSLRAHAEVFEGVAQVHLFGSSLTSENPGDVDLVLVYDHLQEAFILESQASIAEALSALFPRLSVDLTVLRDDELVESEFLQRVSSRRIKG